MYLEEQNYKQTYKLQNRILGFEKCLDTQLSWFIRALGSISSVYGMATTFAVKYVYDTKVSKAYTRCNIRWNTNHFKVRTNFEKVIKTVLRLVTERKYNSLKYYFDTDTHLWFVFYWNYKCSYPRTPHIYVVPLTCKLVIP